jgi:alkane 1-monooxygenase
VVVPPLLLVLAYWSFAWSGSLTASCFFTVFFMFVVYGFLDLVVGRDPSNPTEEMLPSLNADGLYNTYLILCLPLYAATLALGGYVFCNYEGLSILARVGWAMSVGSVGTVLAVTGGHELVHRDNAFQKNIGGILLSLICYGSFKVEHVRGHHVHVATVHDKSTARFGQSLYHFIPRAIVSNMKKAWTLEAARLKALSLSPISWRNEMIWWTAISAGVAAAFYACFGYLGVLFFLGSSVWAFCVLECANYVQHYGLERMQLADGRHEPTRTDHSWNSNFVLSNLSMFQLQRHSDHHESAKIKYQSLRHHATCPQLPAGYPLMMLISCVPPLWRHIMHPRVLALRQRPVAAHADQSRCTTP